MALGAGVGMCCASVGLLVSVGAGVRVGRAVAVGRGVVVGVGVDAAVAVSVGRGEAVRVLVGAVVDVAVGGGGVGVQATTSDTAQSASIERDVIWLNIGWPRFKQQNDTYIQRQLSGPFKYHGRISHDDAMSRSIAGTRETKRVVMT